MDETDKFFETIEEREEKLKAISTEVSQARGIEAKMEVIAKQIELIATMQELTNIAIDGLVEEVNKLNKKNKKLKRQLKECFNIIDGHTEYLGNIPEKLFRIESKLKTDNDVLVTHSELIEKLAEKITFKKPL